MSDVLKRKHEKGYRNQVYFFIENASTKELKVLEAMTSSELQVSNDLTETQPTKDQVLEQQGVRWADNIDGTRSWSISCSVKRAESLAEVAMQEKLIDALISKEDTLTRIWYGKVDSTATPSFVGYKGDARITSFSQDDPVEEESVASFELTGVKELTRVTAADISEIAALMKGATAPATK